MEIILGLIVVAGAAYWLFGRKKDEQPEAVAPYKVDTPAPAPVEAQPVADVVPEAVVVVEEAPAKTKKAKAPAKAKKPAAKKPATKAKKTTTK